MHPAFSKHFPISLARGTMCVRAALAELEIMDQNKEHTSSFIYYHCHVSSHLTSSTQSAPILSSPAEDLTVGLACLSSKRRKASDDAALLAFPMRSKSCLFFLRWSSDPHQHYHRWAGFSNGFGSICGELLWLRRLSTAALVRLTLRTGTMNKRSARK